MDAGETSVEQQLVWVEGEGVADCNKVLEVVREVLAGQVSYLDCVLLARTVPP